MFQCSTHCNDACTPGAFRSGLKIIDDSYKSLSEEEQQRIHRDLYGIEKPIDETPEFVKEKLEELEKEIDNLSETVKKAHTQATAIEHEEKASKYISTRKFRLMFLRAEQFDARKAAARLVRYLQEKLDLFGYEVLPRKITAADLTQQDVEALTSGFFCVTNETDAAGRLVCFLRRNLFFGQNVSSMLRSVFYLFQIALENNEQAQRKGIIVIPYNRGTQHTQWTSKFRNYLPIFRHAAHGLPIRIAAFHIIYNVLLNLAAVVFPSHLRSRFHRHYMTTYEESLFLLLSLGIAPDALPYTEDGMFRKQVLCKFVADWQK